MSKNLVGIVCDAAILGGLGMMFYGLHTYKPWLAFTVTGGTLMAFGLAITIIRR